MKLAERSTIMKKARKIVITLALVAMFAVSAMAYQYISTIFTGKNVYSAGVTVTQTSNTGAIYHLYRTSTNDHSQLTFRTSGTKTVKPTSAANSGKSHYFQVEYATYPSFTYTIN